MTEELFDLDDYIKCPECGDEELADADIVRDDRGNILGCLSCYTNDDCPAGCNEYHPAPNPRTDQEWECPTTGEEFVYCDDCSDWRESGGWQDPINVNGRLICSYCAEDYYSCCDCGDYVHVEDVRWGGEWEDDPYCTGCEPSRRGSDDGTPARCEHCRANPPTHLHIHTEEVLCDVCADAHPPHLLEAA